MERYDVDDDDDARGRRFVAHEALSAVREARGGVDEVVHVVRMVLHERHGRTAAARSRPIRRSDRDQHDCDDDAERQAGACAHGGRKTRQSLGTAGVRTCGERRRRDAAGRRRSLHEERKGEETAGWNARRTTLSRPLRRHRWKRAQVRPRAKLQVVGHLVTTQLHLPIVVCIVHVWRLILRGGRGPDIPSRRNARLGGRKGSGGTVHGCRCGHACCKGCSGAMQIQRSQDGSCVFVRGGRIEGIGSICGRRILVSLLLVL
mmetsp:Transcript_9882/g.60225  ORF Transcript_9882/g.60225 Transcript_9882/m.60225 type:complete len:261 (-) Transcript_9882:1808-2590(-)